MLRHAGPPRGVVGWLDTESLTPVTLFHMNTGRLFTPEEDDLSTDAMVQGAIAAIDGFTGCFNSTSTGTTSSTPTFVTSCATPALRK